MSCPEKHKLRQGRPGAYDSLWPRNESSFRIIEEKNSWFHNAIINPLYYGLFLKTLKKMEEVK